MADEYHGKTCATPNCNKIANLQCPTCLKLGLSGSFFCEQACFKNAWKEHKKVHLKTELKVNDTGEALSGTQLSNLLLDMIQNPWPDFQYTGKLRPFYPLSKKRHVPAHIQRPDYADQKEGLPLSEITSKRSTQIVQLSPKEIEGMRVVCKLAREVLDIVAKAVRPGITTDELDRICHEATIERNCYPSPLNYYQFPKSCCTSVNEVVCHGIPDQRKLEEGDIVNLDVTCYYNGFHGDLNETLFVGNVDESSKHLVKTAYESLIAAANNIKPGARYRDMGQYIQNVAHANGCAVTRTYCGHGIHQLFHTAPNVPHYAKNKAVGIMKPGHVFTIEPMINQGTWRDLLWPDNWTAVTQDGRRSAQFEQTYLVTETGFEILTARKNNRPYFLDQLDEIPI
ncbi:methionine aminopeptidase 1 isoform X2 [Hydra vulgaris]|uniref:Methionine aminopeptidase n=1 Tax=Hydra vulgaris TaxID=6087 RepID=A0ABM4BSU2_HYDVU